MMNAFANSSWRFALALSAMSLTLLPGCCIDENQKVVGVDDWSQLKKSYLKASRSEHDHRIEDWKTVQSWNFDNGELPDGFTVYDGDWQVVDGTLVAVGGKPDGNRTIRIDSCRWPAFRISFDVSLNANEGEPASRIGDVGIRLNADPETGSFAKGYAVILAHYANQAAVIYRLNIPLARTEFHPIEPGQTHRVMVEMVKPHIRAWVDDRVVIEAWERAGRNNRDHGDFLEMDPNRDIVLHTYDSRMVIDNIEIQVPVKK